MQTYTTAQGRVVDLTDLPAELRQFFERCAQAYYDDMPWHEYCRLVEGLENPLLRLTGGVVTWEIWHHPLFEAVRDIESRLGIRQGKTLPDPDYDVERDPLADEWLPVEEAARQKGVTLAGLRRGIAAGRVIAHAAPDEDGRLLVSANSLARWVPRNRRAAAEPRRAVARRAS